MESTLHVCEKHIRARRDTGTDGHSSDVHFCYLRSLRVSDVIPAAEALSAEGRASTAFALLAGFLGLGAAFLGRTRPGCRCCPLARA